MKFDKQRQECNSCLIFHKKNDLINRIEQPQGTKFRLYSSHIQIIILTEGSCTINIAGFNPVVLEQDNILILPRKTDIIIKPETVLKLTVFNLALEVSYFEFLPEETKQALREENNREVKEVCPLQVSEYLKRYLVHLTEFLDNEFACVYYLKLKHIELFHYLSLDYSKQELAKLFAPVINSDIIFAIKVIENYQHVGSIENLAEEMNYSQTDFKRHFMKVFGKSPYRWMYHKKAEQVYHTIICSRKTFKQLAVDLGFSSQSHLNNFCKQVFNASPSEIRKGKRVEIQ
jgi:AraC-like DNA-binding protein